MKHVKARNSNKSEKKRVEEKIRKEISNKKHLRGDILRKANKSDKKRR
jgi:hypothetical protein